MDKPENVTDRNWQIFTDRFVSGVSFVQIAKQHGFSYMRAVKICEETFQKMVDAAPDKSGVALRSLTRLAHPLTKQMWEAIYFADPTAFPGIVPTRNAEYGTTYFVPGQYDATDFARAFSMQEPTDAS